MKHRRMLSPKALTLLCSSIASCSPAPAITSDKLEVLTDSRNPRSVTLKWTGPIDPPMARLFSAEFKRYAGSAEIFVIDLNSPGGDVGEGERVIEEIRKMLPSYSIRTYVGPGNDCLSMCVPIYMQGELRIAAASSQWMFHEPGAVDPLTGNAAFSYEFENRQSAMEVFNRFFKNSDMDPKWREKLRRKIRNGEVWKSARELKDERSKIVMVVEDG